MNTAMKIVVLGPTQSGKTCLAAGLSNTSSGRTLFKKAFVASAHGKSREHLTNLQRTLADEKWPEGTKDPKAKTLDFDFQWKGKKAEFSFDDYNGENVVDPAFRKKLESLGKEDGVVLLVNPGFSYQYVEEPDGARRVPSNDEVVNGGTESGLPIQAASAFEDTSLARKWLVGEAEIYSQLIEDLSKRDGKDKAGKPIVALTVTASDRLKSDLSKFRPQFDAFLATIKNRLETGGFAWEPFEVSITGVLKDQKKPKLESGLANTSAKPFLWLLRKLAWRILIPIWVRRAKWALGVASAIALCVGGYCWYETEKAKDQIATWKSTCLDNITPSARKSAEGSLKDAVAAYNSLRAHRGWYAERASKEADKLEPTVWKAQSNLIHDKIREIEESNGEKGNKADFNAVEEFFEYYNPSTSTNGLAREKNQLQQEWETKKPGLRERYIITQAVKKIETPLGELVGKHGDETLDALRGFYDEYGMLDSSGLSPNAVARLADIATALDERTAAEWADWAIPSFNNAALTNATDEAVRVFRERIEAWQPVTEAGTVAASNLFVSVTNSVTGWRTRYETNRVAMAATAAVKSRDMAELVKCFPSNVATNEFLSADYIESVWTNGTLSSFNDARDQFRNELVADVTKRRGRPRLEQRDIDDIRKECNRVGCPSLLDFTTTTNVIQQRVDQAAQEWDQARRTECEDWVLNNITSSRQKRKGSDLLRAYIRERNKRSDHQEIFNEVVRSAVYRHVETCLSNDVEWFKKHAQDEERFTDFFKPLCLTIVEDAKDPDSVSWAIRFAKRCIDEGHIKDGFKNAFPETFEITQIRGRIVYGGEDPWGYGWAWTQIGVRVVGSQSTEFVSHDKNDQTVISKKNDDWKALWSGKKEITSHLFAPAVLEMSAYDHRRRGASTQVGRIKGWDEPPSSFSLPLVSFEDDIAGKDGKIEFGGSFGNLSYGKMAAYVLVNIKRTSGKTIGELLAEAKEEFQPQK